MRVTSSESIFQKETCFGLVCILTSFSWWKDSGRLPSSFLNPRELGSPILNAVTSPMQGKCRDRSPVPV